MRNFSTLVLFAAFVGLPGYTTAQSPAPADKKAEPALVVPFELLPSRHMVVEVKVNGKGPYRLVFDTGAPINLLTTKIAKEAGVLDPKARQAFPLFGMMGAQNIKTLQLGPAKLENTPAIVMDHPTVMEIGKVFGPIEGIVGFPFFARYAMTIDYQKKQLTLVPNKYKPTDLIAGMMTTVMRATEQGGEPKMVAPAGVWGFTVDKPRGDDDEGVVVTNVLANGPAASGGLKTGDRLLTIDGRWTDTVSDAFAAASLVKPGQEVVVVVKRDGKEVKMKVKPAKGT